ncbi:protein containing ATPase domain, prokaryote [Candidatus Magnetomorum sp. HK-1]|nr:protein containing ATPase domain, prokaryote [Candidatus Magnetomorum sp. HK-1]
MNYFPPKRVFENTGFVDPSKAYHVDLEHVVNSHNQNMKTMVDKGRYFSIFASRQSGKTTFFKRFAGELEDNLDYIFILMSFENCGDFNLQDFYFDIQRKLYKQLINRLEAIQCKQLETVRQFLLSHKLKNCLSFFMLFDELNSIITQKKIVIFIDEFDGIPLHEIKNFLLTLRKLYQEYKDQKEKALYSVGLVGIRNITQLTVDGVSPFNIADHVKLPAFTLKNVRDLYQQYTDETNQPFSEEAVQLIHEQTQGQPWLVNHLATILIRQIKPETTEIINVDDVQKAIHQLLKDDNDHFRNLKTKVLQYKETFKRIHAEPVKYFPDDDAQSWLYQYGLIKEKDDYAVVANPLYSKRFASIDTEGSDISEEKKKIFISYSHEDKKWLDLIVSHLTILKHENIDIWFDDHIKTGEQWSPAIVDAIQSAHMTICLISKNYLNSDFIREREIPVVKAKQKEGMHVFPILISDCLWNIVKWLKKIQIYPEDGIAFEDLQDRERDKKLMQIVRNISEIL